MVYLITGNRDQGKTLYLESLYKETGRGDGIISPKIFRNGCFAGYEVRRLSTGETVPLAVKRDSTGAEWDEACRQGEYSFSRRGLEFARRVFRELDREALTPLYLDEVGPLELSGRGFPLLEVLQNEERDLYLTVRSNLLERLIMGFSLSRYRVLPLP